MNPEREVQAFIIHHLFSVRTLTAVFTDLSTEFGVDAD